MNFYEVGDIFLTLSTDNPANRFIGTWELIAKGRTLVGVDPNDTDFNVVNKTGGSKELQKHDHTYSKAPYSGVYMTGGTATYQAGRALVWGNENATTSSSGNGNSGNLQPYLTCYIWCRTA